MHKHMNDNCYDVENNKESPEANHADYHNPNFDSCFTNKAIKSLNTQRTSE